MKLLALPFRLLAFLSQCVRLALAQTWMHKTKAALTTIGILIGVAATLGVAAGFLGFRGKILAELQSIGTDVVFMSPDVPASGPKSALTSFQLRWKPKHIEGLVERCPSVVSLARQVWIPGGARHAATYTDEVDIMGVSHEYADIFKLNVSRGRPIAADDQENRRCVCVVDSRVIDALNLSPEAVGETIVMLGRTWRVVGVADTREAGAAVSFDDDTPNIYVPFETVYDSNTARMGIVLKASEPRAVADAIAETTFFLRRTREIGPGEPDDFRVQSVQWAIEMFDARARMITFVAAAVVGISLIVAGVGIMNIMLVSVTERTREIGLRKAVGASSAAVLLQFVVEAIAVCLIGGVVGVFAGEGLAMVLRSVAGGLLSMSRVPWWSVGLALGVTTAVGLFFGMFPAVKAARLDPIEALRHE